MAEDFYVFERAGRKFWQVQFRDPRTGKLGSAKSSGKTSEAAAILWAKKQFRELVLVSEAGPKPTMTLRDWASPFFGDDCPYLARKRDEGKTYSAQYIKEYRRAVEKFILPSPMADIPLVDLRRRHVLEWRRRLVAEYGGRRFLTHILGALKVILNEAVYQELIEYSPATKVVAPSYERKPRTALSLEDVIKLLSPTLYEDPRHWAASFFVAYTGARASEVRALSWESLDFEKRLIYIDHAFKLKKVKDETGAYVVQTVLGDPKSGKARVVPMSGVLFNMLKAWEDALTKRQRAGTGERTQHDIPWVFGYSKDRPLGYRQWHDAFEKAAKAAGVEGATLHVLRHTLNTHLRGEVSDIKIRNSFGWSGERIQDNYTHAEMMDYADQAEAIDRLLGGADGKAGSTGRDGGDSGALIVRNAKAR